MDSDILFHVRETVEEGGADMFGSSTSHVHPYNAYALSRQGLSIIICMWSMFRAFLFVPHPSS